MTNFNKGTRKSSQSNRVFVGGIHADVTEDILFDYFSNFGGIQKVQIMKDKVKGISKGYGFVTCHKEETALLIFNTKDHYLFGRNMDIGKAAEKWESKEVKKNLRLRKIFISGVGSEIQEGKISIIFKKSYF
jgi:RNA recognition motif-containing protein